MPFVMLPDLTWPEGNSKAEKQARNGFYAIVRQVEAEVGRGRHDEIVQCLHWMGGYVNDPLSAAPKALDVDWLAGKRLSAAPKALDVDWLAGKRSFAAWKGHVIQHVAQRSWERGWKARAPQQHEPAGLATPTADALAKKSPEEILWGKIADDLKGSFISATWEKHFLFVSLRKAGDGYQLVAPNEDTAWWIREKFWRMVEGSMRLYLGDAGIEVVVDE